MPEQAKRCSGPGWHVAPRAALAASLLGAAACTPNSWGGAYHVLSAESDRVTVEYNPVLTNPGRLVPALIEYCAKSGRRPYMGPQVRTAEGEALQVECRA